MALTIKYDSRFDGAKATSTNDNALIVSYPDSGMFGYASTGQYAISTGYYLEASDTSMVIYLLTTDGTYLVVNLNNPYWTFTTGNKLSTKSSAQAQSVINTIITNNQRIIENNLICARFKDKLTAAQKKQLYDLQKRLQDRNDSLINDGYVKVSTVAAPTGYRQLESYLDQFMQTGGVGSVTAAIVTAAIIVAAATAVYFAYKAYAKESEEDVKFSDNLTAILTSKLTAEEYQQLLAETNGKITKAKLRARFGSKVGIAIAGAALVTLGVILKRINRQ